MYSTEINMNKEKFNLIPVEGHSDLHRDRDTGAILNTNTKAYLDYVRIQEQKEKERSEIDKMKNDINEIKSLLKELINGSK